MDLHQGRIGDLLGQQGFCRELVLIPLLLLRFLLGGRAFDSQSGRRLAVGISSRDCGSCYWQNRTGRSPIEMAPKAFGLDGILKTYSEDRPV
ncbi:hypothetical protein GALMADRAFT_748439 [Galerina marginata CBS 339.88]|uniref:Uncharacterized protein n=1 Tax=Galerina marginata (strain CBS 339.88) TaxID=685588 RepID=A0A067S564_GALM3|nr:hypothetical protein GALMADRAFT_748439 [Galerina marginata CBS 339.88]